MPTFRVHMSNGTVEATASTPVTAANIARKKCPGEAIKKIKVVRAKK